MSECELYRQDKCPVDELQAENKRLKEEMNQLIDIALKIVVTQIDRMVGRPNRIAEPPKKKWAPEDAPLRKDAE